MNTTTKKQTQANKKIPLSEIELNEGQLDGLPSNPRFIKDEKFASLVRSLQESPEFLKARPLLVFQMQNGKYITIAGNMRLRALRELGAKDVPCYVFPKSTSVKKLREYTIKDNMAYGQIDWENIANEWEPEELKGWDFEMPEDWFGEVPELPKNEEEATTGTEAEKQPEVETMLNEATKQAAEEILKQYDTLHGFSFITPGTALFDFINFAYYGKEYPRYNSLAFHPQQFTTAGDQFSTHEGLKRICNDEAKAERLRFVCADKFRAIIGGSLAFSGAKMPLDFPSDLARSLINEFCKERGAVLDPCAGWGGRLVGFLASHASTYNGTDASPEQIKGDDLIWRTFQGFTAHEKAVTLNCTPFEKTTLQNESFDFAITSPPYFDTEKYMGGEQSRETNGSYQEWRENFYRVLIKKVFAALKRNTFFCLQIGSQRYPLLEDGKQIATEIGFEVIEVRPTEMKNNYNKTEEERGEVVIVLHKS